MCGVKGATVLALHPTFDVVHGIVVDDLHGLFLGVTLTLLNIWFDKKRITCMTKRRLQVCKQQQTASGNKLTFLPITCLHYNDTLYTGTSY